MKITHSILIATYACILLTTSCTSSTIMPNSNVRYLSYADSSVRFSIAEIEQQKMGDRAKTYYYFRKNNIHINEGFIDGYPLNGEYLVYNSSNHLICSGYFRKGLKEGKWMYWNAKGVLTGIVEYSKGKYKKTLLPKYPKAKKIEPKGASDTSKHKWYRIFRLKKDAKTKS